MKETEKAIEQFLKKRGWGKPLPVNLAKSIMIEGAELLEHFQWDNQTAAEVKKDKAKIAEIGSELADVLIYCFDMARILNIDAKKAILEKLARTEKKYPPKLMKLGSKEYLKIKQEYRAKKK